MRNSPRRRTPTAGSVATVESLERRQHLTVVNDLNRPGSPGERLTRGDVDRIIAAAASQAASTQIITVVDREGEILGVWAGKDARLSTPVDQTGQGGNILINPFVKSLARARTAAFFQSREDAFSTRTARFIIQDNFPHPVPNTMAGPLYGVQFSTLPFSDFSFNSLGTVTGPAISADPGGIPLFKNDEPVGGIGVSGDGRDFLARADLPFDPRVTFARDAAGNILRDDNGKKAKLVWVGNEESDFDEAVALAGAARFMADFEIQAERIFVAGLRFPFDADRPASGQPNQTLQQLIAAGAGDLINPQQALGNVVITNPNTGQPAPLFRDARKTRGSPTPAYPAAEFGGIDGQLKNQRTSATAGNQFGFVSGGVDATPPNLAGNFFGDDTNEDGVVNAADPQLSVKDVKRIITQASSQALNTRAAIREPIGVPARVHIAVVDRSGSVLGVFRQDDGTIFSYDVAVQKARTAAFFSDNDHALASRSVGFVSQGFFPTGIVKSNGGPLFHLQNALSLGILNALQGVQAGGFANPANPAANPLANGITIFPGGVPLYKDGVLVGGVGISGDGVDQDDLIAWAGSRNYRIDDDDRAALQKRVDFLDEDDLVGHLRERASLMFDLYNLSTPQQPDVTKSRIQRNLDRGLDGVRLPYVKFPRNPNV